MSIHIHSLSPTEATQVRKNMQILKDWLANPKMTKADLARRHKIPYQAFINRLKKLEALWELAQHCEVATVGNVNVWDREKVVIYNTWRDTDKLSIPADAPVDVVKDGSGHILGPMQQQHISHKWNNPLRYVRIDLNSAPPDTELGLGVLLVYTGPAPEPEPEVPAPAPYTISHVIPILTGTEDTSFDLSTTTAADTTS